MATSSPEQRSDRLHGDFGWNTYKDQRDTHELTRSVRSTPTTGGTENFNGDFIEGLDAKDQIRSLCLPRPLLSREPPPEVSRHWHLRQRHSTTGGNLRLGNSPNDCGDGSTAAMNNQMWSYWGDNTVYRKLASQLQQLI